MSLLRGIYYRETEDPLSGGPDTTFNILNTETFTKAMYYGYTEYQNDNEDTNQYAFAPAAYLFLQTLPIKYQLSSDLINKLKSHSGVHELPYAYVLWLGSQFYAYNNGRLRDFSEFRKLSVDDYNGVSFKDLKNTYSIKDDSVLNDYNFSELGLDYLSDETPNTIGEILNGFENKPTIGVGSSNNLLKEWFKFNYKNTPKYTSGNTQRLQVDYGLDNYLIRKLETGGLGTIPSMALYTQPYVNYNNLELVDLTDVNLSGIRILKYLGKVKNNLYVSLTKENETERLQIQNETLENMVSNNSRIQRILKIPAKDLYDKLLFDAQQEYNNNNLSFSRLQSDLVVNLLPSFTTSYNINSLHKTDALDYSNNFIWSDQYNLTYNTPDGALLKTFGTELNSRTDAYMGEKVYHINNGTYNINTGENRELSELIRTIPIHTLEVCQNEFFKFVNVDYFKVSINTYNFKALMFALSTITFEDLTEVTINDELYTVEDQVQLISLPTNNISLDIEINNEQLSDLTLQFLKKAQDKKIQTIINEFMSDTIALSINSVLDYPTEENTKAFIHDIENIDNLRDLLVDVFLMDDDEIYGTLNLFNESDFQNYIFDTNELEKYNFPETVTEGVIYFGILEMFTNENINLVPTEKRVLTLSNYIREALIANKGSDTLFTNFAEEFPDILLTRIKGLITQQKNAANIYLGGFNTLVSGQTQQINENRQRERDALSLAKFKTYYNIKDIFDRWISFQPKGDTNFFNYNEIDDCEENYNLLSDDKDLIDYFSFIDRGNKDISDKFIVDLKWLNSYFSDNLMATDDYVINSTVYKFLSDLASNHNFLLHALPSYTNFDSYDEEEVRSTFLAFDNLDTMSTSPAFIFQYVGDVSSNLDTPSNRTIDDLRQSFCLDNPLTASESIASDVPVDISTGSAAAFIVEYGKTNQEFFKDLELDQSEFQNTEESYKLVTDLVDEKSTIASSNLYDFYISRSYTAAVTTMGNMSIQPLMYFYLKGVPMFYGSYWITNVTHTIRNNQIDTRFRGVRQPISTLPLPEEVTLESITGLLADLNISDDTFDREAVQNPASWSDDTKYGRYLTYADLIRSDFAENNNIDNRVQLTQKAKGQQFTSYEIKENLRYIAENFYDPLIDYINTLLQEGQTVNRSLVSSGFRSQNVNEENPKDQFNASSDHAIGAALDIDLDGAGLVDKTGKLITNRDVFNFFANNNQFKDNNGNYIFDELIWELGPSPLNGGLDTDANISPNWVHLSAKIPNKPKVGENEGRLRYFNGSRYTDFTI